MENGMDGLTPKEKGRRPKVRKPKAPPTPYEQLQKNEYLRAENEYLKKLNALSPEREKLGKSTTKRPSSDHLRTKANLFLAMLLQIAHLPRSSYYYHAARLPRGKKHGPGGGDPQDLRRAQGALWVQAGHPDAAPMGVPDQPQIGHEAHARRTPQL